MTFRRVFWAVFSTALLLGLPWGCAAADDSARPSPGSAGSNGGVEPGNDASVITLDSGAQDSGHLSLNPLCGKRNDETPCVPDSPRSCAAFTPPVAASEDAGAEDAPSSQADANAEGGSGGDSAGSAESSGAGGEGGTSGAAGEAGSAGAGGGSGGPPVTSPVYGCQVQRAESEPHAAFSVCALAGPGGESAPCLTSSDCQAGLGCAAPGLCLRYCCQDADDCESGTYCAERQMRDATSNALPKGSADTAPMIPVCAHAENCDLSVPYPCPKGSECACPSGTACLVVRSDGTTTCAPPGKGKAGDACPCAWGHVCSAATSQCLKLCYTRDTGTCADGKCQAASELPDGWGVCVGATSSGG